MNSFSHILWHVRQLQVIFPSGHDLFLTFVLDNPGSLLLCMALSTTLICIHLICPLALSRQKVNSVFQHCPMKENKGKLRQLTQAQIRRKSFEDCVQRGQVTAGVIITDVSFCQEVPEPRALTPGHACSAPLAGMLLETLLTSLVLLRASIREFRQISEFFKLLLQLLMCSMQTVKTLDSRFA